MDQFVGFFFMDFNLYSKTFYVVDYFSWINVE